MHQVLLDGISNNISSLVQSRNYGSINTIDSTTMDYHDIQFFSEAYNLQEYTTYYAIFSTYGKLVAKAQILSCMQEKISFTGSTGTFFITTRYSVRSLKFDVDYNSLTMAFILKNSSTSIGFIYEFPTQLHVIYLSFI